MQKKPKKNLGYTQTNIYIYTCGCIFVLKLNKVSVHSLSEILEAQKEKEKKKLIRRTKGHWLRPFLINGQAKSRSN